MGELDMTALSGVVAVWPQVIPPGPGTRRRLEPWPGVTDGRDRELLSAARRRTRSGNIRGLFHIAIGRTVTRADGTAISTG